MADRTSAEEWNARLRDGPLSEAERAAFERWRADPANAAELAETERLMAEVDALMATPAMASEAHAALAAHRKRQAGRGLSPPRLGWLAAAAGAAALAAAGLLLVLAPHASIAPPDRYRTEVGGREIVALPDGSSMTLNTDSDARVAFTEAERRVILLEGQALFDVASDPARPFVVAVDGSTVTAVGTVFDVRRDADAITVTLVEGVVDVAVGGSAAPPSSAAPGGDVSAEAAARPTPPAPPSSAPAPSSTVVLQAGEQLVVSRADARLERRAADVEAALGWTEGVLIFRRTRLAAAIVEVNRYTTKPLRLGDPTLGDLELSGVFRAGDVDAFAWSLEQTFSVRIIDQGRERVVVARADAP